MSSSDTAKLQALYLRHRADFLTSHPQAQVGHEAEDALQDVWLRLCEKLPEASGEIRNHRGYLLRMIYNATTSYHRKRQRQQAFQQELAEVLNGSGDPVPVERVLDSRQALQDVSEALDKLPERTREIFLLNRVKGRSYRDIARQLEVSEQTVHYHMRRAMDHLMPLRDRVCADD